MKRKIIGIAGPSGAGKTTACKILKKKSKNIEHVQLDDYFKSPKSFPKKSGFINWELPSNLKFDLLYNDIRLLKNGQVVKHKTITLKPKGIIIVEGFLLFTDSRLRKLFDKKIYLDIPTSLILKRRSLKYGKYVSEYDKKVTLPEFKRHGLIQKNFADYVISGNQIPSAIEKEIKRIIKVD